MKMESQVLPIGVLSHVGPLSNPHMILFIGRSSPHKYSTPLLNLIEVFDLNKCTLVWFESENIKINASLDHKFNRSIGKILRFLPEPLTPPVNIARKIFKLISLILRPTYWGYLVSRLSDPIENQSRGYEKIIEYLGANKEIDILSHSAGGRIAVNLAKLTAIRKLICFGYPFKHPNESADKRRTDPLAKIQKPFLIIQGNIDEYGGWDAQKQYCLSDKIEFLLIESNHEYDRLENQKQAFVNNKIRFFLS